MSKRGLERIGHFRRMHAVQHRPVPRAAGPIQEHRETPEISSQPKLWTVASRQRRTASAHREAPAQLSIAADKKSQAWASSSHAADHTMHARSRSNHRRRGTSVDRTLAALMVTVGTLAGLGTMLLYKLRAPQNLSLEQGCPSGTLMTNDAKQPSYMLRRDFLPGYEFADLQEQLLHRRPLMLPHHLEQGLNAVNINFNLQGMAQLLDKDTADFPIAPLVHLVERLRLEDAHAWSLNIVFAQPSNVQRAGHSGPQDAHVDNLGLVDDSGRRCSLYSYHTSVLYLSVPQDLVGGNLSILRPPTFKEAVANISPEENLLVTFKGDQAHRVEDFRSASMRVSVTLEQYVVPAELYWATVEFHAKRLRY